jgi:hypothetical protein
MNWEVVTSYPWWLYALCVLFSGLLSYALYFWRSNRDTEVFTVGQNRFLTGLRWLGLFLLLFLLFAPLLKLVRPDVIEPKVVVLLDHSQSVIGLSDSTEQQAYLETLTSELRSQVDDRYNMMFIPFGEQILLDEESTSPLKRTNITGAVNAIQDLYAGENHVATVLVSDGIVTAGASPELVSASWRTPVHTIGLGDTTIKRDIRIKSVVTNDVAFLGNSFPIRVTVSGTRLDNDPFTILITFDGKEVGRFVRSGISGSYFEQFNVQVDAEKVGNLPIVASVSALNNEEQTDNNRQINYIEVLDNQQEVVLFAGSPHPDVASIQNALNRRDNIKLQYLSDGRISDEQLANADLFILHDPFSSPEGNNIWQKVSSSTKPVWFIEGNGRLNNAVLKYLGLTASSFSKSFNDAEPVLNPDFQSFELSEAQKEMLKKAPPLTTPFNRYTLNSAKPFIFQQIGSVKTDQILWSVNDQGKARGAFTAGMGLWKWRMYEFRRTGSHQAFDELISSTVQYLSIQEDKRRFVVKPVKQLINEGEEVLFQGSLLNKNLKKVTEPDVRLNLSNGEDEFTYSMSKDSQDYFATIKGLPPGKYTYNGVVEYDGETLFSKGGFTVKEVLVETYNTVANHFLLRKVAKQTGGGFYPSGNWNGLVDKLNASNYPALRVSESWYRDFIHLRWFFFLTAFVFFLEWFFRKFWGSY